jgi:CRP/FNR family transcriptional regulator, cyclic AMP receptor protein
LKELLNIVRFLLVYQLIQATQKEFVFRAELFLKLGGMIKHRTYLRPSGSQSLFMVAMKLLSAVFRIEDEKNCPLYKVDERLFLSEKTLACPKGKEVCLILVRDMTELLFKFLQKQPVYQQEYAGTVFNCSGCKGLIKFSLTGPETFPGQTPGEGAVAAIESATKQFSAKLFDSPLLKVISPDELEGVSKHLREIFVEEGTVLIKKGEQNLNLYIVVEGELCVEDGGVHLATLGEGELCGEMSYLGADEAVSTVLASKKSKVLAVAGDVFGRLLGNNPAVQSFMAQLLASRLRQTNAARTRDFESCMSGRIDEIVPAELFQIFHMHQKTGVLTLHLRGGQGKVSFREGCIINVEYGEMRNEEAIFKILGEKKGLYRFTTGLSPKDMRAAEIGDFMMLLMEGVKRVDEEQER